MWGLALALGVRAFANWRRVPAAEWGGMLGDPTTWRDLRRLPVLVLSQHVEQLYARELLADGSGGVGCSSSSCWPG